MIIMSIVRLMTIMSWKRYRLTFKRHLIYLVPLMDNPEMCWGYKEDVIKETSI